MGVTSAERRQHGGRRRAGRPRRRPAADPLVQQGRAEKHGQGGVERGDDDRHGQELTTGKGSRREWRGRHGEHQATDPAGQGDGHEAGPTGEDAAAEADEAVENGRGRCEKITHAPGVPRRGAPMRQGPAVG